MSKVILKLISRIRNPRYILLDVFNLFSPFLSDERFLKLRFWIVMGRKLDLKNPRGYNDKLQWLKLYDRRPIYTTFVDKYSVKNYVANIIGPEHIIPTLAVWDSIESLDLSHLPTSFVLKTTHDGDSKGVIICKDKSKIDIEAVKNQLAKNMETNYYRFGREWPYKDVRPRIIAEQYLEDESGERRDYKFFCFDGVVRASFVATERSTGDVKFDYYDADFNHIDMVQSHPMSGSIIRKPKNYDKMVKIASELSKGFPHVRVDLYNCNGDIYFGELTLYHYGGMIPFHPEKWDYIFGSWLNLPQKEFMNE